MQNLPKKVRSKKLSSKVDLTAMVSVSFLLIIFFMLVGELSKPKVMELYSRDRECCDCPVPHYGENRSVTILLGENNRLFSYTGILDVPIVPPAETVYGKNGIRKVLLKQNKSMLEYAAKLGKPGNGITVIIKPSKKCNFKNLVDILDEMEINGIKNFGIVNEFTPEETKILASR